MPGRRTVRGASPPDTVDIVDLVELVAWDELRPAVVAPLDDAGDAVVAEPPRGSTMNRSAAPTVRPATGRAVAGKRSPAERNDGGGAGSTAGIGTTTTIGPGARSRSSS